MSRLNKKLDRLSDLLKQFNASIKTPKVGGIKPPSIPKVPGVAPKTQKDPVKIAEQITNPDIKDQVMDQAKTIKEAMRISKSGQWQIIKAEVTTQTTKFPEQKVAPAGPDIESVGPSTAHHSPKQASMLKGLKFSHDRPVTEGVANSHWMSNKSGQDMLVKNAHEHPNYVQRGHGEFNAAHREVMYHNMARDFFDMGKHVPTTALFDRGIEQYSAMKKVPGEHLRIEKGQVADKKHVDVLNKFHDSGDLHKITLMDHIMGHHDRHKKNFLIDSKKGDLHLIDNGTSFDYKNFDPNSIPTFLDKGKKKDRSVKDIEHMQFDKDTKLHKNAKDWLMNLDPKKASGIFADHSYPQASDHVSGFLKRLADIQSKVKSGKYKDLQSLLHENRGEAYNHEKSA